MRIAEPLQKGPETAAPGGPAPDAPKVIKNRFSDIFTGVAFVTPRQQKPYEFKTGTDAGTMQTRLADAVVYMGKDTGMVLAGCGVVHRKYPSGKREILFQWPTMQQGGPIRHAVLNTSNSPAALKDLNAIGVGFLNGPFLKWRAEQVAQGASAPGTGGGIEGITLDAAMLAQFNLGDEPTPEPAK